jgi:hypothetical protein
MSSLFIDYYCFSWVKKRSSFSSTLAIAPIPMNPKAPIPRDVLKVPDFAFPSSPSVKLV